MNIEIVVFYLFGGFAVLSALFILFTKKILHAAFALILTLLSVAAFYVFSGADFLAAAQIMIYVGGILVLLIFGVMFTNQKDGTGLFTSNRNTFVGTLVAIATFGLLGYIQYILTLGLEKTAENTEKTTTVNVGVSLMSDYVLPFEVAGVLLLVALIGASYIAGRSVIGENK